MPRRRRHPLLFAASYIAYLLSFLLAVHYLVFWRPFVREMSDRDKPGVREFATPRYIDASTAKRLGRISADKQSSFVNFPMAKPADVVRVCAFGDSLTNGAEVGRAHDFPSFLQRRFQRAGLDRVQVINFGSGWHGFHQSYIMWEAVGRRFDCDYILLGPRSFQPDRDTAFNHSHLASPYYLHARYILYGNDVQLVDVLGDTYPERFESYFSFFPQWRYLRYDRNPPATILAVLPPNHTLPNPLYYYSGSMQEEAEATYAILLRKLAAAGRQILLLHTNLSVVRVAQGVQQANLAAGRPYVNDRFPYRAPQGHYSASGNQLIAEQFYRQLVDTPDERLSVLETSTPPPERAQASDTARPPLSEFGRIEVRIGDAPAGSFVTFVPERFRTGMEPADRLQDSTAVTALLGITNGGCSLVDAAFISIESTVAAGAEVVLRVGAAERRRDFSLGRMRWLDGRVSIGVVEIEGMAFNDALGVVFSGNAGAPVQEWGDSGSYEVQLAGRPLLHGSIEARRMVLTPVAGALHTLRARESQFVDVDALASSGVFDLVLEHRTRGTLRVPIAEWKKFTVVAPRPDHPLPVRLSTRGAAR